MLTPCTWLSAMLAEVTCTNWGRVRMMFMSEDPVYPMEARSPPIS